MTNPGLQRAMIEFFQEFRKNTAADAGREEILKKREDAMSAQWYTQNIWCHVSKRKQKTWLRFHIRLLI